jgi:hypothetical protein
MSDTIRKFIARSETRYTACNKLDVVVQVEPDGEAPQSLDAELLDLSRHGAKLLLRTPIAFEKPVRLLIQVAALDLELDVSADICWSRPKEGGQWCLGCSFAGELPEEILPKLASAGYLNQRRHSRRDISVEALAKKELTPDSEVAVRLDNLSAGGFRMVSPQPVTPGERLLVKLPNSHDAAYCINARAIWQTGVENGYCVGCSFLNKRGYEVLREVAMPPESARVRLRRALRLSRWGWIGLLGGLLWISVRELLF